MVAVRPGTAGDIAFVAGLERAATSEGFISRFEPHEHARLMADPANLFLVGEDGAGERMGFAILFGLDDLRHGNVLLKRVAVTAPGTGQGAPFLAAVLDRVFARPRSHRLWLTVNAHNPRAPCLRAPRLPGRGHLARGVLVARARALRRVPDVAAAAGLGAARGAIRRASGAEACAGSRTGAPASPALVRESGRGWGTVGRRVTPIREFRSR